MRGAAAHRPGQKQLLSQSVLQATGRQGPSLGFGGARHLGEAGLPRQPVTPGSRRDPAQQVGVPPLHPWERVRPGNSYVSTTES